MTPSERERIPNLITRFIAEYKSHLVKYNKIASSRMLTDKETQEHHAWQWAVQSVREQLEEI